MGGEKAETSGLSGHPGLRHDGAETGGVISALAEVRFRYVATVLVIGLTIWGWLDVRERGQTHPNHADFHRTDFTVYTEAGAAFFDGREPYEVPSPRGLHYLYPPLFALRVSPLAALDFKSQVVVWYIMSIVLAFGCYRESRRLWTLLVTSDADQAGTGPGLAFWVGACAGLTVLFPALECLQRGQVGIALVYPLLLGFRLTLSGRSWPIWWLGGVVLGWPIVVKLIPALPVIFLMLIRWAAAIPTCIPAFSLPVNVAATTRGSLRMASTLLAPMRSVWKAPSGNPARRKSASMARALCGTFDACFRRPTFPAISAGAAKRITCQNGKFHGITARIGPMGK